MEVETTNSTGGGGKLLYITQISLLGRMQTQALSLTGGVKVGSVQLLPVGPECRAAAKGTTPGEQGRREHLGRAIRCECSRKKGAPEKGSTVSSTAKYRKTASRQLGSEGGSARWAPRVLGP